MDNKSTLRADLSEIITRLKQSLDQLGTGIRAESDYPTWGWGEVDTEEARLKSMAMIRCLEYKNEQTPNETMIYPALLGASENTLEQAAHLNQAKTDLKNIIPKFKGLTIQYEDAQGKLKEDDLLKYSLTRLGLPRLHYHQVTRQLVICSHAPYRAGFTWITGSTRVGRTTRDKEISRIKKRINQGEQHDPGLIEDLARLKSLPEDEPLAFYRPPIEHPRVNLAFRIDDQVVRELKLAVLPILYPSSPGDPLPKLKGLALEPPQPEQRRKSRANTEEGRVNPERFLITKSIHRYWEYSNESRLIHHGKNL